MKHKERSAFLCYHDDYRVAVRMLNDAQLGQLCKALYLASIGNPVDENTLDDRVQSIYLMMLIKIQRDAQRYEEMCERQKRNIAKRYNKQEEQTASASTTVYHGIPHLPKETVTEKEEVKEKADEKATAKERETETECAQGAVFVPPAPEEVEDYALSQGKTMDGLRFCDYYTARGWTVGNAPMKDWRAVARIWMRDEAQKAASPPERRPRPVNAQMYTQRTYTEEDLRFNDASLYDAAREKMRTGELT